MSALHSRACSIVRKTRRGGGKQKLREPDQFSVNALTPAELGHQYFDPLRFQLNVVLSTKPVDAKADIL
jgi:hypothetical protein